ncbi:hypothetical protein N136_00135 [Leifsonia aquatica ATCC 14665]|uniref:Uncharacterized protein n=1 Tax=Leifsonia aquatica ATCC 14665 TaxID=1358026 RepID=U2TFV8_LEIAQ|nr:hypothetical protein N136_00135 [Leifsonia aquatica ATCC 14665]
MLLSGSDEPDELACPARWGAGGCAHLGRPQGSRCPVASTRSTARRSPHRMGPGCCGARGGRFVPQAGDDLLELGSDPLRIGADDVGELGRHLINTVRHGHGSSPPSLTRYGSVDTDFLHQ